MCGLCLENRACWANSSVINAEGLRDGAYGLACQAILSDARGM